MNLVLLPLDWLVALVVLAVALRNVNAMTLATAHQVRAANVVLAVSAAAIVFAPAYAPAVAEPVRDWAHLGVLAAIAVLLVAGRRATDRAADRVSGA